MLKEILTKKYNNYDFPFYNNNPRISKFGWSVLIFSILLSAFFFIFVDYAEFTVSVIQCLIILIPLLYYCKWNYSLLVHKLNSDELTLALVMFVGYIIYALIASSILDIVGLFGVSEVSDSLMSLETVISFIFSLFWEELIKFIPLMLFMRIFYKFSENRIVSFIFSSIIVLAGFGLLHYGTGLTLYSVLIIQGLGSIFEIYGYYKTKNLLVPYISHLLTDLFLVGLMFLTF